MKKKKICFNLLIEPDKHLERSSMYHPSSRVAEMLRRDVPRFAEGSDCLPGEHAVIIRQGA